MADIPGRRNLAALFDAVNAIVPSALVGVTRQLDDARLSILYWHAQGVGEYVLAAADVPEALRASGGAPTDADAAVLEANALGAVEWLLIFAGAAGAVSFPMSGDAGTRFWIGVSDPLPLPGGALERLRAVADTSGALLHAPVAADEVAERLRRFELAAELLPAILQVLDVREVFDRLSAVANRALPHDLLILRLLNADLSKVTTFARTGGGADLDVPMPAAYPAAATRAWNFDLVDDHLAHAADRHMPPATMGARASLRFPIRYDNRLIGGLLVMSFEPARYTNVDVLVGRFLADHVAVALSHHELAQRLAEQARSNEELRARTTSIDLLDELLAALIDSGDLREVFGRLSAIAAKVLAHDAATLIVRLANGTHARVFASSGFPAPLPETTEIPEEVLKNPEWEHGILDDLSTFTEPRYVRLATMGFQSLLRVPIRQDGRFAGALVFLSKTVAAFKHADILVARRMADRLAITLARDREFEASRRADEATTRASRLEARVRALTEELDVRTGYRRVVGESAQWREVLTQATQVAATDTTVLLLGESGTGKEVVARFLHRGSARSAGPFIALNCAALPEQLLEAELFGYERGAYTGATQSKPGQLEQAAGGTLFLDEVAEMSPSAQAKFLRVLQEREFQRLGGTRVIRTDARIIAATNRDLLRSIANEQFREDLYYRLNVFAIRLPALRDRPDDILPLSEAFLGEISCGLGRPPAGISRDARRQLIEYRWPGNVRELRNILERAAILCDGGLITADLLALAVPTPTPPAPPAREPAPEVGTAAPPRAAASGELQAMERTMIQQALQNARFNKSRAAKALGLTRHQLYVRMRKYGFD